VSRRHGGGFVWLVMLLRLRCALVRWRFSTMEEIMVASEDEWGSRMKE